LVQARHQIKLLMEQVLLGDPKRILNRGYAIIRNGKNQVITTQVAAQKEASLFIEVVASFYVVQNSLRFINV